MSDDTHKESKHIEPAGDWFWNSWLGKLIVLYVGFRALPMDAVLKQGIKSTTGAASAWLELKWEQGMERVDSAKNWCTFALKCALVAGLVVGTATIFMVLMGIMTVNPYLVAIGSGLSSLYLLVMWLTAQSTLGPLTRMAEEGVNLAGTVLGGVLKKVGLIETKNKDTDVLNLQAVRTFLSQTFWVFIVSLMVGSALTFVTRLSHEAPWRMCGTILLVAPSLSLMVIFGLRAGIDPLKSYKRLYIGAGCMTALILAVGFIPALPERLMTMWVTVNGWVKDWHSAPIGAISMTILVGLAILCSAIAAGHGPTDKKKAAFYAKLAGSSVVLAVALPLFLIGLGSIKPTEVGAVSKRIQDSVVAAVLPNKALQGQSGMEDIKEPRIVAVPTNKEEPKAPEPDLDFRGKSARQILSELE